MAGRARKAIAGLTAALALGLGLVAALALASPGSLQVLSFDTVPAASGVAPEVSAPGPTGGDVLLGPQNTSTILAVVASAGQLDPAVGSDGTLPLPSGFPTGSGAAPVTGVTFAGGSIYGTFWDQTAQTIYVVSWNAQGQLSNGFGTGGLVTIAAGSRFSQWTHAYAPLLIGGHLVIGASRTGQGVTLIPLNPTTGAEGTPVSTPTPGGITSIVQNAMQAGPDGSIYIVGYGPTGNSSSPYDVYYGIFSPSTLDLVSQTAFPDGDTAEGNGLAFLGNTAYLAVTSTTGSATAAHLWSGPVGSTSSLAVQTVPSQVTGENQSFVGIAPGPTGSLLVTVLDQSLSGASSTFALQSDATSFGPGLQVGAGNTAATTVSPAPGGDLVLSGDTLGLSSRETFVAVVGPSTTTTTTTTTTPPPCAPVQLQILKSVVSAELYPYDVKTVSSHHYEVGEPAQHSRQHLVDYEIEVTNSGQCMARSVIVSDVLPSGFSYEGATNPYNFGYTVSAPLSVPPVGSTGGELVEEVNSIPPGYTALFLVAGMPALGAAETNTAGVTADGFAGAASTAFAQTIAAPTATVRTAGQAQIRGQAQPQGSSGIQRVRVAIIRLPTARARATDHCSWLSNASAQFNLSECGQPIWVKATGTRSWHLSLKHPLAAGRYEVFVEAMGRQGLSADTFNPGAGDARKFTVR